jgi:hypothetical protein
MFFWNCFVSFPISAPTWAVQKAAARLYSARIVSAALFKNKQKAASPTIFETISLLWIIGIQKHSGCGRCIYSQLALLISTTKRISRCRCPNTCARITTCPKPLTATRAMTRKATPRCRKTLTQLLKQQGLVLARQPPPPQKVF